MSATIIILTLVVIIILVLKNWFVELLAKKIKAKNYENAQIRLDKWANDKTRKRTGYTANKKTPMKKHWKASKPSKKRTCTSTPEIRKSNGRFG